ncbi:hypothetical protein RUM44_003073 [Polyplax serrata]|uniref:C2H2-type domain-containing protein n=1 Tax=Polyplax serrata TaxID=468196 RepID=A0ABR1AZ99_POLSC
MSATEKPDQQNMHVPVLIISDDGQVQIQAVRNGYESDVHFLPEKAQSFTTTPYDQKAGGPLGEDEAEDGDAQEEEFEDSDPTSNMLANLALKSDVLSNYMEVCITYRCKQCSYTSKNQNEFHKHCLKHLLKDDLSDRRERSAENTAYVYLCSGCSRAFNTAEETKEHMLEEHNLKNDTFGCDEDPEMVRTINISIEADKEGTQSVKGDIRKRKRNLDEIIQGIDPTGSINGFNHFCRKRNCKYKFRSETDLAIHEKCHLDSEFGNGSKRLYQCFECNELFNGWHSCCSHLYKAHEIDCDLLKCPICETYRTSLPLRLENHIRIHSDVRAFTCKYCGKTFKQPSQLRNHIIIHADKTGGQKPNWSRSKQCNICFKMYSDSKSLKKHKEEVHSKLRPFVCSVCGHASARKSMLLMHQRQHTGHKPYECQLCTFRTADHNSLRKHLMRHTGVRPYKCPHCDYTAIQSGSYKNHMRIIHPNMVGMYKCTVCTYRTISEDNYIRHISDHLTGLIKDNDADEDTKDNTNIGSFLCGTTIFMSDSAGEATTEDLTNYYSNQRGEQLVDTGGITIPADLKNIGLDESNS